MELAAAEVRTDDAVHVAGHRVGVHRDELGSEGVLDDFVLEADLRRVVDVLQRASAAAPEDLARRLGPRRSRIDDAQPKVLFTADAGMRGGRAIFYKPLVDEWDIWESLEDSFRPLEKWDD